MLLCAGVVFVYGGRSLDAGLINGFAGGIIEADSRSGVSKGALFELGAGEGYIGGVGKMVSSDGKGLGSAGLIYGGMGGAIPGAHAAGRLVGFGSGAGVLGEVSADGREVGVGAYVNIRSTGCGE